VEGERHRAPVSGGDGARLPGHPGRGRAGGASVLGRRGPGPAQAWVAERESCACVHVPEELAAASADRRVALACASSAGAMVATPINKRSSMKPLVLRGPRWAGSIRSALGQPWRLRAHRPAWPRGPTTAHRLGFEAVPTAELRLEKPGQDRSWLRRLGFAGHYEITMDGSGGGANKDRALLRTHQWDAGLGVAPALAWPGPRHDHQVLFVPTA
jgi:hypothetical protein